MAGRENTDAYFESQYQNAKKLYDKNDQEYEDACLRLLADPALPLHRRVLCCYMVARRFEHHRFYTRQGYEFLDKIETLIQEGRVADRLTPWVNSTRTRFQELQAEIKIPLEEYEAGESTEEEIEDEVDAELEDFEKIAVAETEADTASTIGGHEGGSSVQHSQDMSTFEGTTGRTVSTEQTSIAVEPVKPAERANSPPLHPAVQQMEDDAEMLFGPFPGFEDLTAEEQAAYRESIPERLAKRLREEDDNGEEEPATKK